MEAVSLYEAQSNITENLNLNNTAARTSNPARLTELKWGQIIRRVKGRMEKHAVAGTLIAFSIPKVSKTGSVVRLI